MVKVRGVPGENKFISLLVNHYREIVEKAFKDMECAALYEYTEEFKEKFQILLSQGIWFPDDYWQAHQHAGQNPSQDMILKNRKGYLPISTFTLCGRDFTFKVNNGILPSNAIAKIGK